MRLQAPWPSVKRGWSVLPRPDFGWLELRALQRVTTAGLAGSAGRVDKPKGAPEALMSAIGPYPASKFRTSFHGPLSSV